VNVHSPLEVSQNAIINSEGHCGSFQVVKCELQKDFLACSPMPSSLSEEQLGVDEDAEELLCQATF
jgi:hypothetical protein